MSERKQSIPERIQRLRAQVTNKLGIIAPADPWEGEALSIIAIQQTQLTKAREALRDILDIASGEIPDTFEELDEASANVQAVAQNTIKALDEGSEG